MIEKKYAEQVLLKLLSVEGDSGREGPTAELISDLLKELGIPSSNIHFDDAHKKLEGFTVGNLIVDIPGSMDADRIMFSAHMDRVPVCRGAIPVLKAGKIVADGETGVGADNRTGVAALVVLSSVLMKMGGEHPPITLLFTVGEEVGLAGAKVVSFNDLGNPVMGFNVDGGDPARIVTAAIGADRIKLTVHGRSAHAGMHPEDGVSAAVIAAKAIEALSRNGWHGNVSQSTGRGKSNVGSIHGGEVTNQVMDELTVKAELRSHDKTFLKLMNETWRKTFEQAAEETYSTAGVSGQITYECSHAYNPFEIPQASPVVQIAVEAVKELQLQPNCVKIDGGLDANPLNERGLPTVTLGAGQHGAHTVDEYVDLEEFFTGCDLLVTLVSQISRT